jgi:CheY-like chemotaxis protein
VVRTLENLGFDVSVATSETEALKVIEELGQLDILLTDVVLADGLAGPVLAGAARSRFPDC